MVGVFELDSCAAACRIVTDVLAYFGVRTRPIPVETLVFNEEAVTILKESGGLVLAEAVHAREPEDAGGPWNVGIGLRGTPTYETGAGHVVLWVPGVAGSDATYLLDPSLDQASRPIKNMVLEPEVFELADPAFARVTGSSVEFRIVRDEAPEWPVWVSYEHVDRHKYRDSPNWRGLSDGSREPFRTITAAAIGAARKAR